MLLLDTDVMVDIMRKYMPALDWLASLGSEVIGIPGLVAMELLQGCRNQQEQRRVEDVLHPFKLYWPSPADCTRAYDDFAAYHLSHHISILDSLIAETVVGLGTELATFNDKHYNVIGALKMSRPYRRRTGG